jgi:cellulose synthase/poly-beta-1,6-N-acetylglucosamine synthase-like glycosyltransferase
MITVVIIFWFCVWAIAHSYVIYPLFLQLKIYFKGKRKFQSFSPDEELPYLSILMAAFNEELVLGEKIRSIFDTNYPVEKIELWIGSDNSTDLTNEIIQYFTKEFPNIHFINFENRQGKVSIINHLSEKASGKILLITDANVMFEKNTLFETVRFFKDEWVGLVDTHMKNYGLKKNGISIQEKSYISREVFVKLKIYMKKFRQIFLSTIFLNA